jgi:hypothetical protein
VVRWYRGRLGKHDFTKKQGEAISLITPGVTIPKLALTNPVGARFLIVQW